MLSEELKAQVHAMAAKYRERPNNIVWAADRFPDFRCPQSKPRIRVKAIAYHWHLPPPANSEGVSICVCSPSLGLSAAI
jgi:hypothetical protein